MHSHSHDYLDTNYSTELNVNIYRPASCSSHFSVCFWLTMWRWLTFHLPSFHHTLKSSVNSTLIPETVIIMYFLKISLRFQLGSGVFWQLSKHSQKMSKGDVFFGSALNLLNVCTPVTQRTKAYIVHCVKCSVSNNWLNKNNWIVKIFSYIFPYFMLFTNNNLIILFPNQKSWAFSRITFVNTLMGNKTLSNTLSTLETTQREELTLHLEFWQIGLDRSEQHKDVFLSE